MKQIRSYAKKNKLKTVILLLQALGRKEKARA